MIIATSSPNIASFLHIVFGLEGYSLSEIGKIGKVLTNLNVVAAIFFSFAQSLGNKRSHFVQISRVLLEQQINLQHIDDIFRLNIVLPSLGSNLIDKKPLKLTGKIIIQRPLFLEFLYLLKKFFLLKIVIPHRFEA
jgi:hypothetical protein